MRIAKRGAAVGPSGVTPEQSRVSILQVQKKLAQADVPDAIVPIIHMGAHSTSER